MHPITDKELDKLFKERFEDAEFQPSADVWDKIASKIDRKEKVKKPHSVFWMAAASVVVVLGASLWFYRPIDVIKLQGSHKGEEMAQNTNQSPLSDLGTGAPSLDPHQPEIKGFDFSKLTSSNEQTYVAAQEVTLTESSSDEPSRQNMESLESAVKRNTIEIAQAKNEVKVPRFTGDQSKLDVTQPDMIASADVVADELLSEQEMAAPRKIRSVGSLVNFVISKVDRREDKIIEFTDGDEGSQVSGINLGLIKLKSRNR